MADKIKIVGRVTVGLTLTLSIALTISLHLNVTNVKNNIGNINGNIAIIEKNIDSIENNIKIGNTYIINGDNNSFITAVDGAILNEFNNNLPPLALP